MTFLERFRVKRKHLLSLTYFLIEFRHFCCLRDSLPAFLESTVYPLSQIVIPSALQVIYNNLCPQWNEFFRVSVCHYAKKLHFRVKDQDELGTDQVGEVCIPVEELLKKPKLTINGKELDAELSDMQSD